MVDGTPVLDVKPYLPFCEALAPPAARVFAPDWVDFTMDRSEPLTIVSVEWARGAFRRLSEVWERRGAEKSLYASSAEFCAFCEQALSRDIRSAHRRLSRDADFRGRVWEELPRHFRRAIDPIAAPSPLTMEAVEVDAVPEAWDTSHAACTERVAPRGGASDVD